MSKGQWGGENAVKRVRKMGLLKIETEEDECRGGEVGDKEMGAQGETP